MDLESFDLVQEGVLPLPKKALLSWIGFSRDGVSLLSLIHSHSIFHTHLSSAYSLNPSASVSDPWRCTYRH
jgi:hypothetical protein